MSTFNPTPADVALEHLFRPDWAQSVGVESAWLTDISQNQSDDETRRGLIDRPFRTVSVTYRGISDQGLDAAMLATVVQAQAEGYPLVPIWSDFTHLTDGVVPGATVLPVQQTAYRRFFVGQTVFVVELMPPDPRQGQSRTRFRYTTVTISAIGSTSLTVSAIPSAFGPGARVFPALRSNMNMQVGSKLITRRHAEASVRFPERVGSANGAAPALWTPGTIPTGEQSFNGYPILTLQEDWGTGPTGEAVRQGDLAAVGLDNVANIYGVRPRRRWTPTFAALTRANAWRILTFFDSRAGRLFPFWYPNPEAGLLMESFGTTTVRCRAGFPTVGEVQKRVGRHLCFVLRDGTVTIRRISGVTDDAGRALITLASAIDPLVVNAATVKRASWCSLCRFDSDAISEQWVTDTVLRASVPVIELRTSGDAESVPAVPDVVPSTTGEPSPPAWLPDGNCFTASGVSVPMYQNPCGSCDPLRPVFRVANLSLPTEIRLKFKTGEWSKDALHSHAGGLSNLIAALCTTWTLPYESGYSWSTTTSRHWHHLSSDGFGTWTLTPPTVTRHVWRVVKDYQAQDGSTKQLEVRFVAEYEGTPTSGAWGALFHVYVFSNEINPSYIDGTSFGGITFRRDDPCVWDGSSKKAHPQMAVCAAIPTTMESSCNFARYVPGSYTVDVNFGPANAETNYCSSRSPNVPWIASTPGDETDNSVFGQPLTGYRAMTLNTGCAVSEAMEWLACENTTAGNGLTALKPLNAGWDYLGGTGLIFGSGSAVELTVCDPGQTPGSCCDGHASTANKGTASCWKPSPTGAVQVCASRSSRIKMTLKTVCAEEPQCYDADGNVTEEGGAQRFVRYLTRVLYLPVWDCDYQEGGTQTARRMRWALRERDAKAADNDATETFDDNLLTNWSTVFGTWAAVAGRAVATGVAGSDLNALILYTPHTSFEDFRVEARVGSGSLPFGMMARAASSGTGTTTGYYFEINPAGHGTAGIYRVTSGSKLLIAGYTGTAESPITLAAGDLFIIEVKRSRLVLQKNHPLIFELATNDCTYTSGSIGLATDGSVAGQTWDDVVITDLSVPVGVAYVELDENGWTVSVDASIMPGYDSDFDATIDNPDCGFTEFDCCKANRDYYPKSIFETQSGSQVMQPGCTGGRPATMPESAGVIGDFVACKIEIVDNDPCGTPGNVGCLEVWSSSAVNKVAFP